MGQPPNTFDLLVVSVDLLVPVVGRLQDTFGLVAAPALHHRPMRVLDRDRL